MTDKIRWYIFGDYHCDKCLYSWEERGQEDADAGCFLFGDLRDDCRHIPNPISQLIVNKKINESEMQYDCWNDYCCKWSIAEEIYDAEKEKIANGECSSRFVERFINEHEQNEAAGIIVHLIEEYERIVYPYKKPWEKLKDAFREWIKDFSWRHFKIYFRRER